MLTKKTKSETRRKKRPAATNGALPPYRESLVRRLTAIPEVEAVFIVADGNVVHVYSVLAGHQSRIFKALMKQENLVEKDQPGISFDFHTRVHQGRPPHRAVPFDSELVFLK
jgi:hypothetical protein